MKEIKFTDNFSFALICQYAKQEYTIQWSCD